MGAVKLRAPGAAVAAAVLAAACATAPAPPMALAATPTGDLATANRIYAALSADPIYFFRHVDVRVEDGVASLSGYVWSTDALYRARQIAKGVPGVRSVQTNDLELEREGRDNGVTR
jgi:BON domain